MIDREDQLNLNLNPTPDPQYTFITLKNEYIVENNNKYAKKEKYLSTDGGNQVSSVFHAPLHNH